MQTGKNYGEKMSDCDLIINDILSMSNEGGRIQVDGSQFDVDEDDNAVMDHTGVNYEEVYTEGSSSSQTFAKQQQYAYAAPDHHHHHQAYGQQRMHLHHESSNDHHHNHQTSSNRQHNTQQQPINASSSFGNINNNTSTSSHQIAESSSSISTSITQHQNPMEQLSHILGGNEEANNGDGMMNLNDSASNILSKYFYTIDSHVIENGSAAEESKVVGCSLCSQQVYRGEGLSTLPLENHLRSAHPDTFVKVQQEQANAVADESVEVVNVVSCGEDIADPTYIPIRSTISTQLGVSKADWDKLDNSWPVSSWWHYFARHDTDKTIVTCRLCGRQLNRGIRLSTTPIKNHLK
jgi:hypothetical protein